MTLHVQNSSTIPSPALLFYKDRIERNITLALSMSHGPENLRPHIKTHKCSAVIRMQQAAGIHNYKCATLKEAALLAENGAQDVLIAYPLYGPNRGRLLDLCRRYPNTAFSCLIDHTKGLSALREIFDAAASPNSTAVCVDGQTPPAKGSKLGVFIDVDLGMHRTGTAAAEDVASLVKALATPSAAAQTAGKTDQQESKLIFRGLHAYDGHNKADDLNERRHMAEGALSQLDRIVGVIQNQTGLKQIPEIVLGGTPPFGIYAQALFGPPEAAQASWQPIIQQLKQNSAVIRLSPGTLILYDFSHHQKYSDMSFEVAAAVLTRVISHPGPDGFTLDAGAKALSADHPKRGFLAGLPSAEAGPMSEEHWRFHLTQGTRPALGATLYILPAHVCTAVEHFDRAEVIEETAEGLQKTDSWPIEARGR